MILETRAAGEFNADAEWLEIAAGLLDDDPQLNPDRHIFVESRAGWFRITDGLPQLDKHALIKLRKETAE